MRLRQRTLAFASAGITAAVLLVAGTRASSGATRTFRWPGILPVRKAFYFPDASKAAAALEVSGRDGALKYRLQCYSPDAGRNPFDPYPRAPYSGDFDCHLYPLYGKDRDRTLLTSRQEPRGEQYSRARVLSWELVGACAEYPAWGRQRSFRLRGMSIRFEYSDVRVRAWPGARAPVLRAFRLKVEVDPDADARSAVAEATRFSPPSGDCSRVATRHVEGVVTSSYIRRHGLGSPFQRVRTSSVEWTFPSREDRSFTLPIKSVEGKTVYTLDCRAAIGLAGLDEWGIRCRLVGGSGGIDLLGDAVDPYSQASQALILPEQLFGSCALYPGWGSHRTFRLRGLALSLSMRATFAAVPPNYPPGLVVPQFLLNSVVLKAGVSPDPSADSPVALPPRYIFWGINGGTEGCRQVLLRPAPRGK